MSHEVTDSFQNVIEPRETGASFALDLSLLNTAPPVARAATTPAGPR